MDATRVQHAPNDPADWTKAYADVAAKLDELAARVAAIDKNLAADKYLVTDSTGKVTVIPALGNRMMITASLGVPSVAIPQANSYWTNDEFELFTSVALGVNTFAGRLSADPAALSAASARTILRISAAVKSTDESITNDAVIDDDADLTLPVAANTTYRATVAISVRSHVTPDFAFRIQLPAGATQQLVGHWTQNASSFTQGVRYNVTSGRSLPINNSAVDHVMHLHGLVTIAGTAGDWEFGWSQAISNANSTTLHADSMIHLEEFD